MNTTRVPDPVVIEAALRLEILGENAQGPRAAAGEKRLLEIRLDGMAPPSAVACLLSRYLMAILSSRPQHVRTRSVSARRRQAAQRR